VIEHLKNKKILFIGPKTFNYESEIISCLESYGAIVNYYDDRPYEANFKKIFLRLFPLLFKKGIYKYFKNILIESDHKKYDYIFCIKLECFPLVLLKQLRERQKTAEFIFYTWDSFENSKNAISCFHLFDRAFSFDDQDSKKNGLIHRPLFYLNSYSTIGNKKEIFDIVFIGSVHLHRYKFIKLFLSNLDNEKKCYIYLYVPSKLLFYARKILMYPVYGRSKIRDFKFKSLSSADIIDILEKSKAVLDYSLPSQDGLTMRSIETLGASKKLITNNKNIRNYDFFNSKNILVVDEGNLDVPDNFLKEPYERLDIGIYERYSIKGWVKEVFNIIE
jgi:hypothetical protein